MKFLNFLFPKARKMNNDARQTTAETATREVTGASIFGPGALRAFEHLAALAAEADISGIDDPAAQWLATLRYHMTKYGIVGDMPSLSGIDFKRVTADGVPGLLVRTPHTDLSVRILYIHGGGWAGGSPDDYRNLAGTLAQLTNALIFMPDYRLAPENPYPAGLEDCITSFKWLKGNLAEKPAKKMFIAGDSAGGNLSAATTLSLVEDGGPVPDKLVLIAGTLDNVERSERVRFDDPICSSIAFSMCNSAYVKDKAMLEHPRISPVYASRASLGRFPPTLLQVSTAESLFHDTAKFSARLTDAGARCKVSYWPGMPHVWHAFLGLLPEAREALEEIADFLAR